MNLLDDAATYQSTPTISSLKSQFPIANGLTKLAAEMLAQQGYSPAVIRAYQHFAPLLLENSAIQSWIAETENCDLLPDLQTVAEAVKMADMEYLLTDSEIMNLTALLNQLKTPTAL